jgi:hypothetical protein
MEYLFKPRIIKTFTHQVKNFLQGSQLQAFRAWKGAAGAWVYELKLFPGPKKGFLLGWAPEGEGWALGALESVEDVAWAKEGYEAAQDPVQLFVRAHALNRRIESLEVSGSDDSRWELVLQGGVRLVWERENSRGSRIRVTVKRDGEKDFTRSLELGVLREARLGESEGASDEAAAELVPENAAAPALSSKALKLVAKVQGDVDESRAGLEKLQTLCGFLEGDFDAWGRKDSWGEEASAALEWVHATTKLPAFHASTRAQALETIHDLRRRYRRKLQGAQKRLLEVSARAEGEVDARPREKIPAAAAKDFRATARTEAAKGVGQWLTHPSGLRARIGKSARENAQLFREAGSRDLWFHVRGLGGSHVWVPRGQPLFGAKDESLRDDLELWACQLAIHNSKARHARYGVVDITEKRHLKAARGQEGTLLIGRSETRMADLDEAFEKWLKT